MPLLPKVAHINRKTRLILSLKLNPSLCFHEYKHNSKRKKKSQHSIILYIILYAKSWSITASHIGNLSQETTAVRDTVNLQTKHDIEEVWYVRQLETTREHKTHSAWTHSQARQGPRGIQPSLL